MSGVDAQDDELLALLRAEVDGQSPPPVHTALDDVVRRGRRRLRTRRLGATVGVVAVVAGVGIATSVLRVNLPAGPPANQVNAASSATTMPTWTLATTEPPATHSDSNSCSNGPIVPGETKAAAVDMDNLNRALIDTLHQVAPKASVKITRSTAVRQAASGDQLLGSTWADVIDGGGAGSVYVEVHAFSGIPTAAADNEKFVNGGCAVPQRRVLSDGTVMQLYAVGNYRPAHPSQTLRVYTPAHRLYVITAEGFASSDWTSVPNEPDTLAVPDAAGRHSLPLTESQLGAIGERVAALG